MVDFMLVIVDDSRRAENINDPIIPAYFACTSFRYIGNNTKSFRLVAAGGIDHKISSLKSIQLAQSSSSTQQQP